MVGETADTLAGRIHSKSASPKMPEFSVNTQYLIGSIDG